MTELESSGRKGLSFCLELPLSVDLGQWHKLHARVLFITQAEQAVVLEKLSLLFMLLFKRSRMIILFLELVQ